MKLISITCPNCGAKLQTTSNAKTLTCDYCNCDVMVDDEVKRIQLQNAEQAGYEFEMGRQRALQNLEIEKNLAASAARSGVCPLCGKSIVIDSRYDEATCCFCQNVINVRDAIALTECNRYESMKFYEEAIAIYEQVLQNYPVSGFIKGKIKHLKEKIASHVYISTVIHNFFGRDDLIEFKRDVVVFSKINKSTLNEQYRVCYYNQMSDIKKGIFGIVEFKYPGYSMPIILGVPVNSDNLLKFLLDAKDGYYPTYFWEPLYI